MPSAGANSLSTGANSPSAGVNSPFRRGGPAVPLRVVQGAARQHFPTLGHLYLALARRPLGHVHLTDERGKEETSDWGFWEEHQSVF
eukprot:1824486-Pyramimonas_sp.AAC.1